VVESFQKVNFIRKMHLFRGLSNEELEAIAEKLTEQDCQPDEVILRQGDLGDSFHLIYSGKVIVSRRERGKIEKIADLVAGDHFGEDALVSHARRSATIKAQEETLLLKLSRQDVESLMKRVPALRSKFQVSVLSHRLARARRFTWLEDGEVVYFISRKHPILLWKALIVPILAFLLPVISLILFLFDPQPVYLWLAGITFIVALGALYLRWLDWGNDYYIVTNRRVIYLEKIILLYDSRQEAPLTAVLSVNTQSDVVGRTLGYGDVIIRTFVGNIIFRTIGFPEEVEGLVREHWERTKSSSRRADIDAMKTSIRQKLGLVPATPPEAPPKPATKPVHTFNLFKVRFEEKGIITYRKHWIVWLKQTWVPGVLSILALVLLIRDLLITHPDRQVYLLPELLALSLVMLFLWWLYQTVDWSNDKFQVSDDQIFDIDKTPLGRMQKNVAPLDNILSMEARREGLMQMLFNYGNVYITVGGSQMIFEDVMNPDDVQQDIDQRRVARREKQEREKTLSERERLSEFFAAYHQNAASFQTELDEKKRQEASIPPPDVKPEGDEN
jgi:uncharacterized membrane protein YdbT with pleckstrin-like domain